MFFLRSIQKLPVDKQRQWVSAGPSRPALLLALGMLSGHVIAAEPDNLADIANQELIRQQEREKALRQQLEPSATVRLPASTDTSVSQQIPDSESPCFVIDRIVLNGDESSRFEWALAAASQVEDSALHRCLGSTGINLVMKRIQNAIVAKGYVTTRIVASQQDLTSGTLSLTVIPGRIHAIRFTDNTSGRATAGNAIPAGPGDILNIRAIEQGLENFKRLPSADADIQIEPTSGPDSKPGESDLVVAWKQVFPFRLTLTTDNAGSASTGKYQGSATVFYDNWWTINDMFYISVNQDLGGGSPGARGSRGNAIHYSFPLGYWLLGVTASQSHYYQTVAGANQDYVYSGESSNSEVKLSRLMYRDAVRKTTVFLRGWTRDSQNYIDDTEVQVQRRSMAGWGAGIGHQEFIGKSSLELNVAYMQGTGANKALAAPEEASNTGSSRPQLWSADIQLNVPFELVSQSFRYNTTVRGQWNQTPLVPQDRFSIGGRYTVRGFDGENTLSAERGWLWRNDVGWTVPRLGQELYLGVDYGEVSGPSVLNLAGRRLMGAVVGLRGGYRQVSYDVFAGAPVSKPNRFQTARSVAGFSLSLSL